MTTTPTDRDLLPCPWCRSTNLNTQFQNSVVCNDCQAVGPEIYIGSMSDATAPANRADAAKAWNTRPDRAEIEAATIARLVEQAGVTGEELAKRVNHDESGAYLADDAAVLNQALAADRAKGAADERATVVRWLEQYPSPMNDLDMALRIREICSLIRVGKHAEATAITTGAHHAE